jgi:hypothetical protein
MFDALISCCHRNDEQVARELPAVTLTLGEGRSLPTGSHSE